MTPSGSMRGRVSRLLLVFYFVDVGLVLVVTPWTTFWDRNIFVESFPLVEALLTTSMARGGVSGLGVLNLGAGLADLSVLWRRGAPRSSLSSSAKVWTVPSTRSLRAPARPGEASVLAQAARAPRKTVAGGPPRRR